MLQVWSHPEVHPFLPGIQEAVHSSSCRWFTRSPCLFQHCQNVVAARAAGLDTLFSPPIPDQYTKHNASQQQLEVHRRALPIPTVANCDCCKCCRFGHTHWYTRSCPVYKKQCIPAAADGSQRAPVHLNIGNAGASFSWDVVDPALLTQDIYAAFAMQHGYMRVNATRTSLHIQVHPFNFLAAFVCTIAMLHAWQHVV